MQRNCNWTNMEMVNSENKAELFYNSQLAPFHEKKKFQMRALALLLAIIGLLCFSIISTTTITFVLGHSPTLADDPNFHQDMTLSFLNIPNAASMYHATRSISVESLQKHYESKGWKKLKS